MWNKKRIMFYHIKFIANKRTFLIPIFKVSVYHTFLIFFLIMLPISYLWVKGIDYMKKNHPDYNGDDFI